MWSHLPGPVFKNCVIRGKERQRNIEDKQRDRETDRQRDRETVRQRDRETERRRDGETVRW